MSTRPVQRDRPIETVAGLLAASSIAASVISLVQMPVRIAPLALVVALVAATIGGRHSRLASAAVVVAGVCFVLGMTIAVAFDRPLW